MPIYPFLCLKCKKEFEVITLTVGEAEEEANQICPVCCSNDTKKLIGSFMWRFGSPAGDRNERKDK